MQNKRSLKVNRTRKESQESINVTPDILRQMVRAEIEKSGLQDLLNWKREVDHNMQVMGVILLDLQRTANEALADGGSSKSRLDELVSNLSSTFNNVGILVGVAQSDEDSEFYDAQAGDRAADPQVGGQYLADALPEWARDMPSETEPEEYEDDDIIADACEAAEEVEPTRRRRRVR